MKIELAELENIIVGGKEIIEKELPIKTSFRISRTLKKVQEEYEIYDEKRKSIISKFSKKDKDGKIIENEGKVTIENTSMFQKEINELDSIEIELDIEKISINDLGEIDISPKALILLDSVLED